MSFPCLRQDERAQRGIPWRCEGGRRGHSRCHGIPRRSAPRLSCRRQGDDSIALQRTVNRYQPSDSSMTLSTPPASTSGGAAAGRQPPRRRRAGRRGPARPRAALCRPGRAGAAGRQGDGEGGRRRRDRPRVRREARRRGPTRGAPVSRRRGCTAGWRRRGRTARRGGRRGRRTRDRARAPWRAALRRATASAASDRSVAVTRLPGSSSASVTARHPDPVPTSSTRGRAASESATARSTISSVSGRGISTSGVTASSRPQNGQLPTMWWAGSPAPRRASHAANVVAAAAATSASE